MANPRIDEGATVVVNGQERQLPPDGRLLTVLEALGIQAQERGVAVAVNGEVVPRQEWDGTHLAAGAKIEVLRAVQGG